MIFSHFLKYCYRCLPSWITSYRIITIENNFFLLKIISVCIGPGFTIWAYKKYWHFWSSGSKVDLKDTNHIFIWLVILTISTFRRVWLFVLTNFMFLLQIWCIEKKSWDVNCFSDYQDGLQTDESRHQVKGKVHMCWYIRGRKNTVEVCSCGEHSIWKHKLLLCNRVFLLYLFD